MVVANGVTGGIPDVFVRIELRTGEGNIEKLQAQMLEQKMTDKFTTLPSGSVKEQQNRLGRKDHEQMR